MKETVLSESHTGVLFKNGGKDRAIPIHLKSCLHSNKKADCKITVCPPSLIKSFDNLITRKKKTFVAVRESNEPQNDQNLI